MWRTDFHATGNDRKRLVKALERAVDQKATYLGIPSYAYRVGDFTVTKEGSLEFDDSVAENEALMEHIYAVLEEAGFRTGTDEEDAEEPEEEGLRSFLVSVPLSQHTGNSLRNLINLIYTRAGLLNKALGTGFRVDEGLTNWLDSGLNDVPAEKMLSVIAQYEAEHGKALEGILLEDGKVTFCGFPDTGDAAKVHAFASVCGLMNKQALESRRIQAKQVNEENEKYALRIWLVRLGMCGPEYKDDRAILMANLTGHCAFRNDEEKERWTARQIQKRDALRAAKEAAHENH